MSSVVAAVTRLIGDHGFPAVVLLMTLESACIPVPSEVIQLFAGYLVSLHRMSLLAAVSAGVLGNVLGSWIAWGAGYWGGRPFLERYGQLVHVTPARLDRTERWFVERGDSAVLIGRCVPLVRSFISLPAGVARMPFWRFTLFTLIGCTPWVLALTLIGVGVGPAWERWRHRFEYLDYVVVAAIVVAIAALLVRRHRTRSVRDA